MTSLIERFGRRADLGPCIVGQNLNLLVLRGFAKIETLSCLSGPDIFDEVLNDSGTQRDLIRPHATECIEYAVGSVSVDSQADPRCFPEIILNARDKGAIEVYDLKDPERLLDFSSFADPSEFDTKLVGVRVLVDELPFPTPRFNPKISRVDGNHRLSGIDIDDVLAGEDEDSEVVVPFSMLVGLETDQEVKLFRDINGEHKGMDVTHLMNISTRLEGDSLVNDERRRHVWYARKLMEQNRAFAGKVFLGGSKSGVKQRYGQVPPLKLNTLASAIRTQLQLAHVTRSKNLGPEAMLLLLDNFWKAVSETFPAEWADKRNYILLQTIGLNGFAELGAALLDNAVTTKKFTTEDFLPPLRAAREAVSLARDDEQWRGVAGAGGAKRVAQALISAATGSEADRISIESQLGVAGGRSNLSALDSDDG